MSGVQDLPVDEMVSTSVVEATINQLVSTSMSTMIITDISGVQDLPVDEMVSTSVVEATINQPVSMSMPTMIIADISGGMLSAPPPLSITDLMNSYEMKVAKEAADRAAVTTFTTLSVDGLKPALYKWAATGFSAGYVVNTLSISPPDLCIDGVSRSLTYYFEYLIGNSIQSWLQGLEGLTHGMMFTFSHDGSNTILLHVTRT
jgi:hypothetical protein